MLIVHNNQFYIVYSDGLDCADHEAEVRELFPEFQLILTCFGQYENAWVLT